MMTIEKLDELRDHANKMLEKRREAVRAVEAGETPTTTPRDVARANYAVAKGAVNAALREWWAQGCKAPAFRVNAPYPMPVLHNPDAEALSGQGGPPAFVTPSLGNVLEAAWAECARSEAERADKAEATLAAVVARKSAQRNPPVRCAYCDMPINADETMIGAGDGSGSVFAHDVCYWRKQANLRQEEMDTRVKEAVQHNDAYHGARYEEQAKTLQRTRDLIMERSNNIRDCIIAIRGLLKVVGPATENAACHADLVDRRKCSRCSRIDYATKALARLPTSLLSEASKVEP